MLSQINLNLVFLFSVFGFRIYRNELAICASNYNCFEKLPEKLTGHQSDGHEVTIWGFSTIGHYTVEVAELRLG